MIQRLLYTLALLSATMQTFAQSSKTKYEYDAKNRLSKVTYANGTVVDFTYDKLGNRKSKKTQATNAGVPTNIEETRKPTTDDNTFYNLSGQRVNRPAKGVYIRNGKKKIHKK